MASRIATLATPRLGMFAVRLVVSCFLAFWIWFAGTAVLNEGARALLPAGAIIASLAAVGFAAWLWGRLGGVILVCAGVFAACFFHHPAPLLMMAAPMVLGGAALVVLAPKARRAAGL